MKNLTSRQKGNITVGQLVGWGLTIALFAGGGILTAFNINASKADTLTETLSTVKERVAVVETKSDQFKEDLALINKKLDAILWSQNINPSFIEKAIPISTAKK